MERILVIQTAFIGDAILGTALLEKLHLDHPNATIDYLVREGNESLFQEHPFLGQVLVWRKRSHKYTGLVKLLQQIRKNRYDAVYNIQRYAASGLLTAFSGARQRVGYRSNPFAFLFTHAVNHRFGKGFEQVHEVDRVLDLVHAGERILPKLYPTSADFRLVDELMHNDYITVAPASVWYTKQFPVEKWVEFLDLVPEKVTVYCIGAASDRSTAKQIMQQVWRPVIDLTGRLSLLQTAALMTRARMNYANDSAPVHLASAVNAPITEVYCSTVPGFGFTPLSDRAHIVETDRQLDCRPCGMHGRANCPLDHFACATSIDVQRLLATLSVQ